MQNYKNFNQDDNIFQAVQERYTIEEVTRGLGITLRQVGGSLRADSIVGTGEGKDAFCVYPKSNTWYDFMLRIGGDITDLVAYVKYNGDKGAALRELMPEWTSEKIKIQISKRDEFQKTIERWQSEIFNQSKKSSRLALEYLHSRRITDETIKRLKIGIDPSFGKFRICVPYFDEAGKRVLYYTSRRFDWTGNGEDVKEPKYKKASLEANPFLQNVPWGLHTLNRGNDEVWLTEGTLDAVHLDQAGFSVLSSNGGEFGKSWPQVIEKIKNFKQAILAFDNDKKGEEFTYKAAQILVKNRIPFKVAVFLPKDIAEHFEHGGDAETLKKLTREGRRWFMEYIRPNAPLDELSIVEREKAKEKCKEFIKQIAPYTDSADIHDILIALRRYFPKEWLSEVFKIARKGLTEDDVKLKLAQNYSLIYNERTGFYEYADNGIWEARDDTTIQGYIQDAYGRFATGGKLTSTLKMVKAYKEINSQIPLKMLNSLPVISFANGTLHIDTKTGKGTLKPHSKSDYTTVKLPYRNESDAKYEEWRKFLDDITGGDKEVQKVLQEFAGYALLPTCQFQKALMLIGGGSNGKSIFTNILSAMLGGIGDGRGYISAAEPSKFAKDFRLMPFKTSWLNISSDTETDLRGGEGVFKKIVAGEVLEDSYKHKNPFPFKTRTKLIMCCNGMPTVNDTSDGFMRRWLIVNLQQRYVEREDFKPGSKDKILDPYLEEKLMEELPGIFNWALEGLQRLLAQNGFTKTKEQKKLLNEFRRANNAVYSFVEDTQENFYEENGEGKEVKRSEIFDNYVKWTVNCQELPICRRRFYSNLRSILACMGIQFEERGRKIKFQDVQLTSEAI